MRVTIQPSTRVQTIIQPRTQSIRQPSESSHTTVDSQQTLQPRTELEGISQPTTESQETSQPPVDSQQTLQPRTELEGISQPTTEPLTTQHQKLMQADIPKNSQPMDKSGIIPVQGKCIDWSMK